MELLGNINERQVYYCNVRSEAEWFNHLPGEPWIAFTIANKNDEALLDQMTQKCLDTPVCYTCSAGEAASLTEDSFDGEIVLREVQKEMKTGQAPDFEATPMTSYHKNFSEGFWFACTLARQIINDTYVKSEIIICIDCTERGVRYHLLSLIGKINKGWLPSDEEIELPQYDNQ